MLPNDDHVLRHCSVLGSGTWPSLFKKLCGSVDEGSTVEEEEIVSQIRELYVAVVTRSFDEGFTALARLRCEASECASLWPLLASLTGQNDGKQAGTN
jgi:dihydrodipicolinate synthase/N-acetylneuraminate lyase